MLQKHNGGMGWVKVKTRNAMKLAVKLTYHNLRNDVLEAREKLFFSPTNLRFLEQETNGYWKMKGFIDFDQSTDQENIYLF
jgi:hypothetical protein